MVTHSLTSSLTHSLSRSLTHSLTQPLNHSLTHALAHSIACSHPPHGRPGCVSYHSAKPHCPTCPALHALPILPCPSPALHACRPAGLPTCLPRQTLHRPADQVGQAGQPPHPPPAIQVTSPPTYHTSHLTPHLPYKSPQPPPTIQVTSALPSLSSMHGSYYPQPATASYPPPMPATASLYPTQPCPH